MIAFYLCATLADFSALVRGYITPPHLLSRSKAASDKLPGATASLYLHPLPLLPRRQSTLPPLLATLYRTLL